MLLRYTRLVFRGTALVLVASLTFGLLLAIHARFLGIALGAMLVSWFFKYCFVLLDATLAGQEPPVLSVEMVNPFNEQRPLGQATLIAGGCLLVIAAAAYLGPVCAFVLAAALVFVLPASIAVLGLDDNFLFAAWPPRWLEIIRALGWDYVVINAVTLGAFGGVYLLASSGAPLFVTIAAVQLAALLIFTLIGGGLFDHRVDLGLESRSPRERMEERDRREHQRARQQAIDHAYENFRHNKAAEGWREIEGWLATHAVADRQLIEYHAVLDAACVWDDVRPGDKLTNELIALLLERRQAGDALEVTEQRLKSNPQFRPANAVRLAELAGLAGKRVLRRQLEPESSP